MPLEVTSYEEPLPLEVESEPELEVEELLEDMLSLTFEMVGCSCAGVLSGGWDEKKELKWILSLRYRHSSDEGPFEPRACRQRRSKRQHYDFKLSNHTTKELGVPIGFVG